MNVVVDDAPVFVHTGGVVFAPDRPVVVLVHGAGQDHSLFRFHTRALAHSGVSPLAVDLPGHGRSGGVVLESVPAMAAWLIRLLDALSVERVIVMGHSMGSLIAIEAAAAYPDRMAGIVLTGSGASMPVHPDLQQAADNADHLAVELISGWTHTGRDRMGAHPQPGSWTRGMTERLAEQELGRSLGEDLAACSSYDAAGRAVEVTVPMTLIIGTADAMTSARAGHTLAEALTGVRVVEVVGTGHNVVMDRPAVVRSEILELVQNRLGTDDRWMAGI